MYVEVYMDEVVTYIMDVLEVASDCSEKLEVELAKTAVVEDVYGVRLD